MAEETKDTKEEKLAQSEPKNPMSGLTEGRIVHYVMPNGEHRPAIVVRVWRVQDYEGGQVSGLPHPPENGVCQLQVFTGGTNDAGWTGHDDPLLAKYGIDTEQVKAGLSWRTSVLFSAEPQPNTWHWIEYQK